VAKDGPEVDEDLDDDEGQEEEQIGNMVVAQYDKVRFQATRRLASTSTPQLNLRHMHAVLLVPPLQPCGGLNYALICAGGTEQKPVEVCDEAWHSTHRRTRVCV
jgi:hypothetical protein